MGGLRCKRLPPEAPVGPAILRIAVPNISVIVVQASIGRTQTYFVAKLGLGCPRGYGVGLATIHAAANGVGGTTMILRYVLQCLIAVGGNTWIA
jgi:hypothetical protein